VRTSNPIRGILTPGVIFGALIFGAGLFLVTFLSLKWTRPTKTPAGVVTAALTIISAPTETFIPPTLVAAKATPNPNVPPAPPSGEIIIGGFVQISGTEGAGLRLRLGPGLDHNPEFLGLESEVFKIEAGPQEADGFVWWYLTAPFEVDRKGWAVSNYLEVVQNP
jgi:hypothetical protein